MMNSQIIWKIILLVKKNLGILSSSEIENYDFLFIENENNKNNILKNFDSMILGAAVLWLVQGTGAELMPLYVTFSLYI